MSTQDPKPRYTGNPVAWQIDGVPDLQAWHRRHAKRGAALLRRLADLDPADLDALRKDAKEWLVDEDD